MWVFSWNSFGFQLRRINASSSSLEIGDGRHSIAYQMVMGIGEPASRGSNFLSMLTSMMIAQEVLV
jgi:hypothetical protein